MRPRTVLAVAFLASATLVPRCAGRRTVDATPPISSPPVAEVEPVADSFQTTIRPILSEQCGACHNPGGKMYARLPFDDREVVSSHGAAILRRLKGDDRAAMDRWLSGLAPADAAR